MAADVQELMVLRHHIKKTVLIENMNMFISKILYHLYKPDDVTQIWKDIIQNLYNY